MASKRQTFSTNKNFYKTKINCFLILSKSYVRAKDVSKKAQAVGSVKTRLFSCLS